MSPPSLPNFSPSSPPLFPLSLTTLDVLRDDADVAIPVWPALLVPASQSVKHLVQDDPLKLTPSTDGDVLGSPTNAPNEGETAAEWGK